MEPTQVIPRYSENKMQKGQKISNDIASDIALNYENDDIQSVSGKFPPNYENAKVQTADGKFVPAKIAPAILSSGDNHGILTSIADNKIIALTIVIIILAIVFLVFYLRRNQAPKNEMRAEFTKRIQNDDQKLQYAQMKNMQQDNVNTNYYSKNKIEELLKLSEMRRLNEMQEQQNRTASAQNEGVKSKEKFGGQKNREEKPQQNNSEPISAPDESYSQIDPQKMQQEFDRNVMAYNSGGYNLSPGTFQRNETMNSGGYNLSPGTFQRNETMNPEGFAGISIFTVGVNMIDTDLESELNYINQQFGATPTTSYSRGAKITEIESDENDSPEPQRRNLNSDINSGKLIGEQQEDNADNVSEKEMQRDASINTPIFCAAITKSNKQCKLRPVAGSEFCMRHISS